MFENMSTQVLTEHLYGRTCDPPIGPAGDPRPLDAHRTPSRTADADLALRAAPHHTLDTPIDDPYRADAGLLVRREHPTEGAIADPAPANSVSAGHRTDRRAAPALGEHVAAQPFSADEAHAWGMVDRVREQGTVRDAALRTAARIASNAPLSVRQAEKSIHFGLQGDLHTGYRVELEAYCRLLDTEDRHEGIAAFNVKRAPRFGGR